MYQPNVYRARRQNMPPLPVTRDDIVLEGQWAVTNDNEPFILHQDNDMVLLGTDSNLHLLSTADTIFMDGTFKISPRQFVQLFTLHIIHMGFFVPLVYGLLKDKSAETYYHMFAHIRRKMAELNLILNPVSLMLDFESGIQPCLRQHFPTATIKGSTSISLKQYGAKYNHWVWSLTTSPVSLDESSSRSWHYRSYHAYGFVKRLQQSP